MDDVLGVVEQAQAMVSLMSSLARELLVLAQDPVAGLSVPQLRVFSLLSEGERTMTSLGRELGVSQSAMTQIADRLERAGLVQRVAGRTDRRIRCLCLTPRGEELLQKRKSIRQVRMGSVLGHLSADERRSVLHAMETLLAACRAGKEADAIAVPSQEDLSVGFLSDFRSAPQETAPRVSR